MSTPVTPPAEPLEERCFLSSATAHNPAPVSSPASAQYAAIAAPTPSTGDTGNVNGGPDGEDVTGGPSSDNQVSPSQGNSNANGEPADTSNAQDGNQVDASDVVGTTSSGQEASGNVIDPTRGTDGGPTGVVVQPESVERPQGVDIAVPSKVTEAVLEASQETGHAGMQALASSGEFRHPEATHTIFNSCHPITATLITASQSADTHAPIPHTAAEIVGRAEADTVVPPRGEAPIVEQAARALWDFGRFDLLSSFADTIAGFAHESAAVGTLVAEAQTHNVAWTVSAIVLGADAILVGHWYAARRRAAREGAAGQDQLSFPFAS